jgi:predicted RecA/RadA family phage recombinase
MFELMFLHGDPVMVDWTPGAAVAAGEVVVVGNTPMVAHAAIPASTLGALASHGGVYQGLSGGAIGVGVLVYWDNAANRVTTTAAGNTALGWSLNATAGASENVRVQHMPRPA